MVVRVSLRVRTAALTKALNGLVNDLQQDPLEALQSAMWLIRHDLVETPAPYSSDHPFVWASERQRRFVMFALSTGDIEIPYRRTGNYARSWRIEKIKAGYKLYSTWSKAANVAGTITDPFRQFHLHRNRWKPLRWAVEDVVQGGLNDDLAKEVYYSARRRGFE